MRKKLSSVGLQQSMLDGHKKENITTLWRDIPKNICFTLAAATIVITGTVAAVLIELVYEVFVRL